MHGGSKNQPAGPNAPAYRHGGRMRPEYVPEETRRAERKARRDPGLLAPAAVAAFVQALMLGYLGKLDQAPGAAELAILLPLIDRRLTAIAQHDRQLRWKATTLTPGQLQAFMRTFIDATNRYVPDEAARRALQREIELAARAGRFDGEHETD
jgi:hypothetical protein